LIKQFFLAILRLKLTLKQIKGAQLSHSKYAQQ